MKRRIFCLENVLFFFCTTHFSVFLLCFGLYFLTLPRICAYSSGNCMYKMNLRRKQ